MISRFYFAMFAALVALAPSALAQSADLAPSSDDLSVSVELSGPIVRPYAERGNPLFDNGPLVNSLGTGVGGADESVLQSVSLGMTTLGAGHQVAGNNFMADDFEVPASSGGWDLTEVVTFAYQTGAGTGASTMTQVFMCILDGAPSTSPNVVWGDCASNVMNATSYSGILRVTETTTGTATDRAIFAQASTVVTSLAPGTYWLQWATDGSLASGPWAPPITITGQTTTGNAEQCVAGACAAFVDGGTATPQGMPFLIVGSVVVANEPGVGLPEGYRISEAYPNPFNPQTQIVLEVGATQDVTADVYNALGQRVARLFDGTVAHGQSQTITFEASGLPSGSYVVRLVGEEFSATRRVSLIK